MDKFSDLIFSKTTLAFLQKVKLLSYEIFEKELKLPVGRSRFVFKNSSYPIHFVVFEHPSKLGYFQAEIYEIGINKGLLYESEMIVKDVLRHELAHYLTYLEFGSSVAYHGKEFRSICLKYGWKEEVFLATINLQARKAKVESIGKKVQKLFALAASHNLHEAEAAMIKAHELLLKHQLSRNELKQEGEEMILRRPLKEERNSVKLQTIASILRHFFVYPVLNVGKGMVYLEILGKEEDVTIGEYVACFLDRHLETLWTLSKKKHPVLKGLKGKHSFFRGVAEGMEEKMKHRIRREGPRALILTEKRLQEGAKHVYPHLRRGKALYSCDEKAKALGKEKGRSLSINMGIEPSTPRSTISLDFSPRISTSS